ncbi:N-acetylmuramoyl-L-alanine amidase [Brevibacillus borstelensis]|uniref:N-acetylmuramoyl-L-alanine amidase n=1 Tax=Brevibacillus borstelensis TaxID=45462 RepID=UPI001FAA2EA3|nr:N-acetylmuramoyl-L-alanine amidase [Brevibacillus borstelensis]
MKIAIDAGHGPETPGKRTPDDSMREFHFNSVVARYVRDELKQYDGVETLFTHADDGSRDVPLQERTDKANAWRADAFVSIHANAFGNDWNDANGIETFVYTSRPPAAVKLAEAVQRALVLATGRKNRGVKAENFHVLRETNMTAILAECGFMTNREEAELLKSDTYRRACARAIVTGLAEVYGLKRAIAAGTLPQKVTIEINGVRLSAQGYLQNGVSLLPVRAVAEAVGVVPAWNPAAKQVSVNGLALNGTIESGTAYAPARELASALGLKVEWDGAIKTVKLSKSCICR